MKVRVTFGLDKIKEGFYNYEANIIDDLKALDKPGMPFPQHGIPATKVKGLDTEYAADGELLTVGLSNESIGAGIEQVDKHAPIIKRALRETDWLIGHSVPGDIDQLAKNNLQVKEDWYTGKKLLDSYLLAKMVDENKPRGSYNLETLMLTNFAVQPWKGPTEKKLKETGDARDWTPEEREERCRIDAWASFMLARKFYQDLLSNDKVPENQNKLLIQTIHRIGMILYRIGLAGAKVDQEYLAKFKQENKVATARGEMHLAALAREAGWDRPEPFSPTKDDDIRHLLYDIKKLVPVGYTKQDKPTVDRVSLKQHEEQLPNFIKALLEYNKVQKLDSVYGDIETYIDEAGYLHWWINQLGARTGRRSSGGGEEGTPGSKNSQNWPPGAKQMIVSRFKGGKIGAFDYQSLEPILYAWISKDENLFDFFYNGRGYLDVCKRVLGWDIDKKDKIYRAIKSMTLGIFYNMQDKKMAMNLWLGVGMPEPFRFSDDWGEHRAQTGKYRRQILGLFSGLTRYIEKQKLLLGRDQQIIAPDGFVRHLPHHGEKGERYWSLVNQAINFPVQHLASMVCGSAMIDVEAALLSERQISYKEWHDSLHDLKNPYTSSIIINEVHDCLVFDMPPETYSRDIEIIFETMKTVPSLHKLVPGFNIPLKIEEKIGEYWDG